MNELMFVDEDVPVVAQIPSYVRRGTISPERFYTFLLLVFLLHIGVIVGYCLLTVVFLKPVTQPAAVDLVPWGTEVDLDNDANLEDKVSQQAMQSAVSKATQSVDTPPSGDQSTTGKLAREPEPIGVKKQDIPLHKSPELPQSLPKDSSRPTRGTEPTSNLKPTSGAAPSVPKASSSPPVSTSATAGSDAATQAEVRSPVTSDDRGPKPLTNAKPPYPHAALRAKQEGVVYMILDINIDGSVHRAELSSTSGVESLDQSALNAALKWTFSPAIRGGRPAAERIRIGVQFDLQSQ